MATDKKPVNLTQRQQDLLASLMEKLSGHVYRFTADRSGYKFRPDALINDFEEWVLAACVKSQELGVIYDIMHRTGWNDHP